MDIQKEREAFESWFESRYDAHFMQFALDLDLYADKHTQTCWEAWQAAKAQAVLEVKPSRCVTLTCAQLREAFMFGAPDKDDQEQLETEMTISWSENGHSGKGYYCYYSDLPEEGAIFLDDVIEAQEQAYESK